MKKNQINPELVGTLCMYGAVIIWGGTYFFQKFLLMGNVPVFYLIGIRFSFVILLFFKCNPFKIPKSTWISGGLTGVFLFLAFASQNYGLTTVDISIAAFITGLTVIFTPILNFLIFRSKFQSLYIVSIILATIGVYFFNLTVDHVFVMNIGVLFCLFGSILFSLHVISTSYFLKNAVPIEFNIAQLTSCAILGYIFSGLTQESLPSNWTFETIFALVYLGAMGSVLCFLLQTIGQKHIKNVVKIGLILALEPIFATIPAVIFGVEILSQTKVLGMTAIFIAVLLSEYQEYLSHKTQGLKIQN
ncbi:MAG: DMT family transporter [Brevinema sp.]